jgi:hypothetical protein
MVRISPILTLSVLSPTDETAVADLAETSAEARAKADILEREIARDADIIIERFMTRHGNSIV